MLSSSSSTVESPGWSIFSGLSVAQISSLSALSLPLSTLDLMIGEHCRRDNKTGFANDEENANWGGLQRTSLLQMVLFQNL